MNCILVKSVLCAILCTGVLGNSVSLGQGIDPPCPLDFQYQIILPEGGHFYVFSATDCALQGGECVQTPSGVHSLWFDEFVDVGCDDVDEGECRCAAEVEPISDQRNGRAAGVDGLVDLELPPKSRVVFEAARKNYLAYFRDDQGTVDDGDDVYYLGIMYQPDGGAEDSIGTALRLNAAPREFPREDGYPPKKLEMATRDGNTLTFQEHKFDIVQTLDK